MVFHVPVSYTHLDVYKRQEQLRVWTKDAAGKDQLATLKQANVGALSLASVDTPFDLKAVSYTHLDVYKRQGHTITAVGAE